VSLRSDILRVPILLRLIYCTDDAGATSCPVVIVYPKTFRNFRVNVFLYIECIYVYIYIHINILNCMTKNFVLNLPRYGTNGFLFLSDDYRLTNILCVWRICGMYILYHCLVVLWRRRTRTYITGKYHGNTEVNHFSTTVKYIGFSELLIIKRL